MIKYAQATDALLDFDDKFKRSKDRFHGHKLA